MIVLPRNEVAWLNHDMGTGIGKGLENLAQSKMQQLQQRHQIGQTARGYQSIGLPPQIAFLPPEAQKALLRNFGEEGGFSRLLERGQQQPEQQGNFGQAMMQDQQQPMQQQFNRQMPMQPPSQQDVLQQSMQGGFNPQRALQEYQQQQLSQQQGQKKPRTIAEVNAQNQSMGKMQEPWQILQHKPIGKTQREFYNEARKEQHYIDKEVKPYISTLEKKAGPVAQLAYPTLSRMEKLINEDDLTSPFIYNTWKKLEHAGAVVGGGLGTAAGALAGGFLGSAVPGVGTLAGIGSGATIGGGLGTAAGAAGIPKFVGSKADQEFTKLGLSFMNGMKDIFGGTVPLGEMQIFLDTFPTLSQTKEGKQAIIRNMRLTLDGWTHRKKVAERIKREHGGYWPRNIDELVEDRSKPYLDRVWANMISGEREQ